MNKQDFRSRDARLGFLLVLPAVILVILVVILPIISGIQISFTSQRVVGSEFEFIGPKNYFELFWRQTVYRFTRKECDLGSCKWVLPNFGSASDRIAAQSAFSGSKFCSDLDHLAMGCSCSGDRDSVAMDV